MGKDGGLLDPFLDILYDNPPHTVYNHVWGTEEYHSADNYKEREIEIELTEIEKPIASDLKMED